MSVEFYGWQVINDDNGHLKSGQEVQNGRGYTMYHGTHKNNAANIICSGFVQSKDGLLGPGVYVSRDFHKARAYPHGIPDSDRVIFKLKVRVGKVKKIDTDNHPHQKAWHQNGYNTAWVPPNCGIKTILSGREEDCVWDPKRITVVDIAYADHQTKKDLKKLIHQQTRAKKVQVKGQCDICGHQKQSSHVTERCWGCEKTICPFMSKHVCKKSGTNGTMALTFFGWETTYDNNHHLESDQEPVNGREYIMYHGTSVSNAKSIIQSGFRQSSKGMLGPGVYVSRDKEKARRYPLNTPNDRVILMLKVQVGKVKKIDTENHPMGTTWNQEGYDTAWVPPNCGMRNVPSGLEEDCVWDPKRIRVVDVINSPHPSTTQQLKDLLQASVSGEPVFGPEAPEQCGVCKNRIAPSHQLQLCWGCGQTICPFMRKHFCKRNRHNTEPRGCKFDITINSNPPDGKIIFMQRVTTIWNALPEGMVEADSLVSFKIGRTFEKEKSGGLWGKSRASLQIHLISMACSYGNMWAEEDGPDFIEACLQSYKAPKDGKIYVMYHGTDIRNVQSICNPKIGFQRSTKGMLGPGVYVSRDIQKASRYPLDLPESQKAVLKLRVNVGKVIKIDRQGHPLQKSWQRHGYDTAWCPPNCGMVPSGLEEDCVWDPNRIKVVKVIHSPPCPGPRTFHGIKEQGGRLREIIFMQRVTTIWNALPEGMVEADSLVSFKIGRTFEKEKSGGLWGKSRAGLKVHLIIMACSYENMWAEEDAPDFTEASLESYVSPKDGKIYEMYHGTDIRNVQFILKNGFQQSNNGTLGPGVYVSRDYRNARKYPLRLPESQKVVLKLRVNVGKVIRINYQGHPLRKSWQWHGYDTAWCPPNCGMVPSGLEEDCVWDPNRIKVVKVIHPSPCPGPRTFHGWS
ncbi:grass carp reovirus (GCRV)-induced gene 2o [Heptranchias perlo]|uniref:grass carp reovirus (GCRV)-induced gene 2o n=1 Tax=Heptranchias perlo TaxID=212740 RepID=UPI003559500C